MQQSLQFYVQRRGRGYYPGQAFQQGTSFVSEDSRNHAFCCISKEGSIYVDFEGVSHRWFPTQRWLRSRGREEIDALPFQLPDHRRGMLVEIMHHSLRDGLKDDEACIAFYVFSF
ncbi:uncharacterized protein LOC130136790 isoform X2 [Syzygium oleosum]|uniref:uncharacterized protein LOC130136790 isoform X2 n=1 Tax=Syzygium oleosum TaxID=219896 RepID=UPI0024B91B66|nr:uncharacterized protein LOC130136790 isoform X2 [Syzygium oleosum]